MAVVIEIENVSKKYQRTSPGVMALLAGVIKSLKGHNKTIENTNQNEFFALKNISLKINEGESVGITGENGAGKSTLLKLIYGVTTPTNGSVKIRGAITGFLDILVGFHHEYTGRENVFFSGAFLGASKKALLREFDNIVQFAELEGHMDTPIKKYSSGMCLRLAFSIAVHLEHEILLFDEIFAVGDNNFQQKCQKKLNDLIHTKNKTVLLASHDRDLVKNVCSRVIELHQGELINDRLL
jgi:lipopolysaccharide transport system ATP-binding protein